MTKYLIDYEEVDYKEFKQELEDTINDYVRDNYDDLLNETYPEYKIGYSSFSASTILKECDPTAYKCGIDDFANAELEDAQYQLEVRSEYSVLDKTFTIEEEDEDEED